jgi:hypothetical protein
MSETETPNEYSLFSAGPKLISHSFEDLCAGIAHEEGDPRCMICESEKWCPARYNYNYWDTSDPNRVTIHGRTYEQWLMDLACCLMKFVGGE